MSLNNKAFEVYKCLKKVKHIEKGKKNLKLIGITNSLERLFTVTKTNKIILKELQATLNIMLSNHNYFCLTNNVDKIK